MAATLLLEPGFQTSDIVLAILWAPSDKKWSLYEYELGYFFFYSFYQALGTLKQNN